MTETKADRTKRRLLDAAIDQFGAVGFRSASVAAIARDAGVTAPAAFSYWRSKEALFEAALDDDARQVINDLLEMLGGKADPDVVTDVAEAAWLLLVDDLVTVLSSHPLARRVLAGEEPEFLDRLFRLAAFDGLRDMLTAAIKTEQARGLNRTDIDAHRAAIGMETITLALTMAVLRLEEPVSAERRTGVAEILLAALRPPEA